MNSNIIYESICPTCGENKFKALVIIRTERESRPCADCPDSKDVDIDLNAEPVYTTEFEATLKCIACDSPTIIKDEALLIIFVEKKK